MTTAAQEDTERSDARGGAESRLITRPFVIVTVSALAFFMYIGTLVPLVPLFIEGPLNGGEFGVGINAAVFALAAIFARPVLGRLADRFGRRSIIIAGALTAATGGMLMSQVDSSLALLMLLRAMTGIGEAAVFVGTATLIADLSPRDRRAEGASYFSVAVFSGLGVGPVFSEWLLDDVHFERTFIAAGGFAIAAALIAIFAPARVESPDDDLSHFDSGQAAAGPFKELATSGIFKFIHPAAILPGSVLALGVAGLTTFFLFIPEYARETGLKNSGGLFLAYALVSLLIRLFGAKLPERMGPRRAVSIALLSMAAGLVVFAAVPTVAGLWVGATLVGVGAAFNYPSLMAITVDTSTDVERASAISSFTMFFEIGSAACGLTVGVLAQLVGKQIGFLGGAVSCLIGLWVLRTKLAPVEVAAQPVLVG